VQELPLVVRAAIYILAVAVSVAAGVIVVARTRVLHITSDPSVPLA
jgi:hypothetical protein